MVEIYTDGSCIKDNAGGFGVVVVEDHKLVKVYSERALNTTNNQMELLAILWAIKYSINNYTNQKVIIYSDSQYSVSALTVWATGWERNNWKRPGDKPVLNLDLIKEGYSLLNEYSNIVLTKVKGHSGIEYNEIADQLATNTSCKKLCYGKNIKTCKYFDNELFECIIGFHDLYDRYMIAKSAEQN